MVRGAAPHETNSEHAGPTLPAVGGAAAETWTATLRTGIVLILATGLFFSLLDTIAKYLAADYPVIQVVWARYLFQMLMVPFMLGGVNVVHVLRTNNLLLQIVRSLFLLGATAFFFTALRFLPLADATAIGFVAPLFLTALSIPMLGERVGLRRWSAVIAGFIGALVIIRPGLGVAHWAVVLPLATALCFSLYQITTRLLVTVDPPRTTFVYTGLVGTLVMTAVVPFVWRPPSAAAWGLMVCAGLLGGVGHYCLIKAYQRTAASVLAPFTFSTMVWVTLLGLVVFGDFPDGPTLVGALIIIASGVYVFYREGVVKRRTRERDTAARQ